MAGFRTLEAEEASTAGAPPTAMTEAQLREEVYRFASRFGGRISEAADRVRRTASTPEERLIIQTRKSELINALVNIAVGPVPEANLLDMVVLTSLVRMVIEDHWASLFAGNKQMEAVIAVAREAEEDIWGVAAKVITTEEQAALRDLIHSWQQRHPEQTFVSDVRFSNFSEEFGPDATAAASQSHGLLPEVTEATRSVDELRLTTERALFLTQHLPLMASSEAKIVALELLVLPEVKAMSANSERFAMSAETISRTAAELPELVEREREAAIDQLMGRAREEREAILAEFDAREERLQGMVAQLQTLASQVGLAAGESGERLMRR